MEQVRSLDKTALMSAVRQYPAIERYFCYFTDRAPSDQERVSFLDSRIQSIADDYAMRSDAQGLQSTTVDSPLLTSVLDDVAADLRKITYTVVTSAHLAHMTLSRGHAFGDGLSIRPALPQDITELLTEFEPFAPTALHSTLAIRAIVQEVVEVPRPDLGGVRRPPKDDLLLLIALFRVVSDGALPVVRAKRVINSPSFHNSSMSPPVFDLRTHGEEVTLDEEIMTRAESLWSRLGTSLNRDVIERMIRRFSYGRDRLRPDDALVDFVVGIEAPLSSRQETVYKVSMRLAALVGTNGDERRQIFEQMQDVYNVRSRIVHGESVDPQRVIAALNTAREYLRKLILSLILLDERFNATALDIRVASGP